MFAEGNHTLQQCPKVKTRQGLNARVQPSKAVYSKLAVGGLAVSLLLVSTANASTVSIGISLTDSSFTTVASGTGTALISGQTLGGFSSIQVAAAGNPTLSLPTVLDSNTIVVAGSSGTLWIAVTSQGNTTPLAGFLSSFTANAISPGWSVTETMWLDTGNGLYTQVTPLGSPTFTAIGTSTTGTGASTGSNFSVTQLYEIASVGVGNSNDTIDLSATPLPAALPIFATGLGAIGLLGWRRKRKNASALAA